jgi:hypothetical protein
VARYSLKRGDTKPLRVRLERADGTPIDLTGSTVRFLMAGSVPGLPNIAASATVLQGTLDPNGNLYGKGMVEYVWGVAETDVVGLYRSSFEITDAAGDIESVPNEGHLSLQIEPSP